MKKVVLSIPDKAIISVDQVNDGHYITVQNIDDKKEIAIICREDYMKGRYRCRGVELLTGGNVWPLFACESLHECIKKIISYKRILFDIFVFNTPKEMFDWISGQLK